MFAKLRSSRTWLRWTVVLVAILALAGLPTPTAPPAAQAAPAPAGAWSVVTSPLSYNLYSVAFSTASDGWAVSGDDGTGGEGGKILHYQAVTWSVDSSPTIAYLYAVAFPSTSEGWAIG